MKKYIEVIIHVSIWTIAYLVLINSVTTVQDFRKDEGPLWLAILFGTVMNQIIFYTIAFYLVPKYLGAKKIKKLITLLLIVFLAVNLFESFIDYSYLVNHFSTAQESFQVYFLYNFVMGFFILLVALTYALLKYWVQNEKLKRVLLEEKLTTEMMFLKSQINPHFLFNVLNIFYAQSLKNDVPELADGISKLAQLLRYMVYETNEDKVFLINEINHLKNFISIYKLRIAEEDDVSIDFEVKGNIDSIKISPMLLIPFVENAIKHGIDTKEESVINISITILKKSLRFEVINTIHKTSNTLLEEHIGFGLDNLKKRLSILYNEKHTLKTKVVKGKFISLLNLQLD